MPSILIVDSTVYIALDRIGRLELLRQCASEVWMPPAVQGEIGPSVPAWVRVVPVADQTRVRVLQAFLGKGEAEAIALGLEHADALLVLDDLDARKMASHLGLRFTGTLGLVLAAKRLGLVDSVRPIVDDLEAHGFRMDQALKSRVLDLSGE